MARTKACAIVLAVFGIALCLPAQAADGPQWQRYGGGPQWPDFHRKPVRYPAPRPVASVEGEFGARYWFSSSNTAKDLYNVAGNALVSRLTYDGLQGHAGEMFGRADHSGGLYLKGYFGGGLLHRGNLVDEDFPPFVAPYSSTDSAQRNGTLYYGAIDGGFNLVKRPGLRVGAFAGYHNFTQHLHAYGCLQMAGNTNVCGGGGVAPDVRVISQDNTWHSLRVGVDADIALSDRLMLRLDGAYVPYVRLDGADSHWLRIGTNNGNFAGPIPEDGSGRGYQIDAMLSYALNQYVSFGVGGRYWRMESSGFTHFEGNVVGQNASPQPLDWKTEIYGVFVQGSFKFGPYAAGSSF